MARNTLANALFEGDGTLLTHLLMLDADQGFESPDVLKMICADKKVIARPTTVNRHSISYPGAVTKRLGQFDFTWDATSIAELNALMNAAQSAVT
jgi:hypothetical protein